MRRQIRPLPLSAAGTTFPASKRSSHTVDWGKPTTVEPAKKFDAANADLAAVVQLLSDMRKALRRKGFAGGAVKVWAGEDAYNAMLRIVQSYSGKTIEAKRQEDCIMLGSTKIVMRNEEYPHPTKKDSWMPILDKKTLRMIDPNGGHVLPYCAVDDLDAKLAPLPLFIKPIKQDDPSGYKLVAQSKPFPAPNTSAVADSVVL